MNKQTNKAQPSRNTCWRAQEDYQRFEKKDVTKGKPNTVS
jgi:hypothetical protein